MNPIKLGLVGMDSSHAEIFAALFNDDTNPNHIPHARIVAGFAGGSSDFPLSISRVEGYREKLKTQYGVRIVASPREVAATVDAILLTTVDGRRHLEQFNEMAPFQRRVFVDKPFATNSADARAIAAIAHKHTISTFGASSLRFAEPLRSALADTSGGRVIGCDFCGPLHLQPTQPGLFWYGIHAVEMLFAAMGRGCEMVRVVSAQDHEIAVGRWHDGRLGSVRGNRVGNNSFSGVIHRETCDQWCAVPPGNSAFVRMAESIVAFFRNGKPPVSLDETLETIRFIEAANESRENHGKEISI